VNLIPLVKFPFVVYLHIHTMALLIVHTFLVLLSAMPHFASGSFLRATNATMSTNDLAASVASGSDSLEANAKVTQFAARGKGLDDGDASDDMIDEDAQTDNEDLDSISDTQESENDAIEAQNVADAAEAQAEGTRPATEVLGDLKEDESYDGEEAGAGQHASFVQDVSDGARDGDAAATSSLIDTLKRHAALFGNWHGDEEDIQDESDIADEDAHDDTEDESDIDNEEDHEGADAESDTDDEEGLEDTEEGEEEEEEAEGDEESTEEGTEGEDGEADLEVAEGEGDEEEPSEVDPEAQGSVENTEDADAENVEAGSDEI